jgi:hypothetical protein
MNRRSALWVGVALLVVVALGTVVVMQVNVSTPTSTTITKALAQPGAAIWPYASTITRFTDPTMATRQFAADYLGFTSPLVGAFHSTTTGSGQVPVKASRSGVTTTVSLRRFTSSNTWWIIGATSPEIVITAPSIMQTISSPVQLAGRSTAYEAVVNVQIRRDGSLAAITRTTVMGGSMGVMGPFSKTVAYVVPTAAGGAVLLRTYSAKDGHVLEATAVRVRFRR